MHVGQNFGQFEIEKELGSGAMGTVYRARLRQDGKSDQTVALKVIAFGLSGNEQALARFEREAKILKQLRHPNIVRLLGTGRYRGTPFFAMEFVDGQSLDKVMIDRQAGVANRPPFTWEEVIELGKPLCSALQHAHDKGIIHRDLKPSNLMMTREGILKLTDFGIAKDLDVTALTGANNTIGTAAYMSPEQCKGERHLTGKSDLYSLGVVFYELLTGRKPFMAESSVDMFLLHVSGTFARPGQLNPDIPVWLDTLVCQMLEKKPEHRPRDAAMVGQVLEEIAEKVASQVSVGADVAAARAIDTRGLADEDKAAARLLKAGSRKKKLRKKRRPIYSRGWFVAIACLLVVGGMGWAFWKFALAPPEAGSLLAKIDSAKNVDARKDAIADYLKHYADRDDEATRRVKSLDREFRVKERERVLFNRYKIDRLRSRPEEDDDPDAYTKTMAAITAENQGNVADARRIWTELADRYAREPGESKAMWGWLAQKKLADVSGAERHLATLLKKLEDEYRLEDKDARFDDELENQVVEAARLEQLGDTDRAHDRWLQIATNLEGSDEGRPLFVLARGKTRELGSNRKPTNPTERAALLAGIVAESRALLGMTIPARQRDGRNRLRDIRDLYAGESGPVGRVVDEAKKLLNEYRPA